MAENCPYLGQKLTKNKPLNILFSRINHASGNSWLFHNAGVGIVLVSHGIYFLILQPEFYVKMNISSPKKLQPETQCH
jgi:hypothetical protein